MFSVHSMLDELIIKKSLVIVNVDMCLRKTQLGYSYYRDTNFFQKI